MKILLLSLSILFTQVSFSQNLTELSAIPDSLLSLTQRILLESLKEKPDSPITLLNKDSLISSIYGSDSARHEIDLSADYQLLGFYSNYWEEIVGQPSTTAESGNFIFIDGKRYLKISSQMPSYGGVELVSEFEIDSVFYQEQTKLKAINNSAFFIARQSPLNRNWMPVSYDNKMILRYMHNYPNGNMTSFTYEVFIFFERIKR